MQQAPHALYLRLLAVVAAALVCVALAGRIRDTALVDVQTIATTPSTIVKSTTPSTTTTTATIPQSGATAALLFDATAQTVLAAQNADRRVAPASLTKLVTAAVALQHLKPDAKLTVGAEIGMVHANSSLCYIRRGQRLTLENLLYGMLLESGNDAAYTVAVHTARAAFPAEKLTDKRAVQRFCELMNRYAANIGMTNSHFSTPDGWDDKAQYTTARDLLTLTQRVLEIPELAAIAGTARRQVALSSGYTITWKNSNLLLQKSSRYYDPRVTGLKTGTTDRAGNCLIACAAQGERRIISIVLGCSTDRQRYTMTKKLLESALGAAPTTQQSRTGGQK